MGPSGSSKIRSSRPQSKNAKVDMIGCFWTRKRRKRVKGGQESRVEHEEEKKSKEWAGEQSGA